VRLPKSRFRSPYNIHSLGLASLIPCRVLRGGVVSLPEIACVECAENWSEPFDFFGDGVVFVNQWVCVFSSHVVSFVFPQ